MPFYHRPPADRGPLRPRSPMALGQAAATPTPTELAEAAVETCGEGRAVLLSNHGLVALGGDIGAAFSLAVNLEYTAELQYRALCIGSPRVLSDGQMAAVRRRFASYGQPGGEKGGY